MKKSTICEKAGGRQTAPADRPGRMSSEEMQARRVATQHLMRTIVSQAEGSSVRDIENKLGLGMKPTGFVNRKVAEFPSNGRNLTRYLDGTRTQGVNDLSAIAVTAVRKRLLQSSDHEAKRLQTFFRAPDLVGQLINYGEAGDVDIRLAVSCLKRNGVELLD
jgi:hypothetical protein